MILTYCSNGLAYTVVAPVVFRKDVVHRFLYHHLQCFLQERRNAELPFHEVAYQHHQVLSKAGEEKHVVAYIVDVLATLLDAAVDFLEEIIADTIKVLQHLLAGVGDDLEVPVPARRKPAE